MGAFFTNLHVRTDDSVRVIDALRPLLSQRAYVSPPKSGWVTIYDETADANDESELARLAAALSKNLNTAAIAFLVHDSDVLIYLLFDNGTEIDRYNSCPDYFGPVDPKAITKYQGKPEILLAYCVPGTALQPIQSAIKSPGSRAESKLAVFAALLGIDDARAAEGFNYFLEDGKETTPDADDFVLIAAHRARRNKNNTKPAEVTLGLPYGPVYFLKQAEFLPLVLRTVALKSAEPLYRVIHYLCSARGSDIQYSTQGVLLSSESVAESKSIIRGAVASMKTNSLQTANFPDAPSRDDLIAAFEKSAAELAAYLAGITPSVLPIVAFEAVGSDSELLGCILDMGLPLAILDPDGCTLLHRACLRNNKQAARLLLLRGADVNAKDPNGTIALMLACLLGDFDMVCLLLGNGADHLIQRIDGHTPLSLARLAAESFVTPNASEVPALLTGKNP
jgi:hypothetical protein